MIRATFADIHRFDVDFDNISDAAWAVLQAVHELQDGDSHASIDVSAIRAAAFTI